MELNTRIMLCSLRIWRHPPPTCVIKLANNAGHRMMLRSIFAGLMVSMAPPFAAMAQDVPPPASAEDCAVLAAVGDVTLKWREQSPGDPMLAGTFGENCDWQAMAIKPFAIPPRPGRYYEGVRFAFSMPVYSADGLSADVTFSLNGSASAKRYFYSLSYCTAYKTDGRWQSAHCRPGPIT